MKKLFFSVFLLGFFITANAQSVFEKDFTKSAASEVWEPKPKSVTPGIRNGPPSDAIVLFDGKSLDSWVLAKDGSPNPWTLENNVMTIKPRSGTIKTKKSFGDCQLHLEYLIVKNSEGRAGPGNSGIFIQQRYEVQIYNDESPLYANGQVGSIYKQVIPMANASNRPGEWNAYDIFYTAPRFRSNGSVEQPAFITVVLNGILVLNHFEIQGTIKYIGFPRYELHNKAPIELQDHSNEVSFRNIWIREL